MFKVFFFFSKFEKTASQLQLFRWMMQCCRSLNVPDYKTSPTFPSAWGWEDNFIFTFGRTYPLINYCDKCNCHILFQNWQMILNPTILTIQGVIIAYSAACTGTYPRPQIGAQSQPLVSPTCAKQGDKMIDVHSWVCRRPTCPPWSSGIQQRPPDPIGIQSMHFSLRSPLSRSCDCLMSVPSPG